jgi:hypothetical protein
MSKEVDVIDCLEWKMEAKKKSESKKQETRKDEI